MQGIKWIYPRRRQALHEWNEPTCSTAGEWDGSEVNPGGVFQKNGLVRSRDTPSGTGGKLLIPFSEMIFRQLHFLTVGLCHFCAVPKTFSFFSSSELCIIDLLGFDSGLRRFREINNHLVLCSSLWVCHTCSFTGGIVIRMRPPSLRSSFTAFSYQGGIPSAVDFFCSWTMHRFLDMIHMFSFLGANWSLGQRKVGC